MSDMREDVTVEFHRAKRTADGLRPEDPSTTTDPVRIAAYREAVREYAITFEIAEREAKRRRAEIGRASCRERGEVLDGAVGRSKKMGCGSCEWDRRQERM